MNKKKILATVAAVVMAATMSLPAFAEATPGEVVNQNAYELMTGLDKLKNPASMTEEEVEAATDKAVKNVKECVSSLSAMQKAVVTETIANAMVDIYTNPSLKDLKDEVFGVEKENGNVKVSGASADVTIEPCKTDTESGEVSVTVEALEDQSDSGYIVAITMPEGVPDGTQYRVKDGDSGVIYAYNDGDKIGEDIPFSVQGGELIFWVPHFTTYTLVPFPVGNPGNATNNGNSGNTNTTPAAPSSTAAPDASKNNIQYYTCKACGYHNWTATEEGYRCDNCGYIESQKQLAGYGNVKGVYAPKTGTENPIKATGADMNSTAFVVVALAVAAAFGMGYVAKKSGKAE